MDIQKYATRGIGKTSQYFNYVAISYRIHGVRPVLAGFFTVKAGFQHKWLNFKLQNSVTLYSSA